MSVGPIRSQIAAEGLLIAQRSQWRAYGKSPSLFPMVPSLTYDLPSPPQMGFHMPPRYVNGHISATGDPIHFMFGSRVGFSGTADRMTLFSFRTNPRWRPPPSWKKLKWPYLRNWSSDPLHLCCQGSVFVVGGSNGAIFGSNKSKMAAPAILKNFKWPYLCNSSYDPLI